MAELKASVKIAASVTGADKVDALGQSVDGLEAAGAGARRAAADVDEVGLAAQRAEQKATPAHRNIREGVQSISTQLGELRAAYLAWEAAQAATGAVAGIAATADAYANLTARIKMAVGEGAAFTQAFEGVQDVALRTGTSLEATGQLFIKLADAGKQMGLGQADALRLTETVNQAIQLSGASAQASEAAVTQLIQGLQGGVLRGDEFNSVMEQSPRLAKALADGLGVTTGELRKMAEAGQLSSETVIKGLQGQAKAVETEFGRLPPTIGRAITELSTQWQVWIGQLDQSTGASTAAAGAIKSLADNFDGVAAGLINAGQAWLGWKAYNIAAEFLSLKAAVATATAAKTADTAATVANTAATATNTAAQLANNSAKAGAAAAADAAAVGAGRLAGALSLLKGFSLAFLVTNFADIGKWLGEAAAKAMGYGKAIEDNERQMKAADKAARELAAANAELAQKKQLAADKALGLSKEAKKLVADFGDLTEKGNSTSEALGKIGKDLDLSNVKGITDAGAALDALAVRGKISAEQVRTAWQQALAGQDLMKFEVQARAAFDGSEQGVRRLAAALDAQLGEALRRTGKDAGELAGSVNTAAQRAINDFDVLAGRVDDLRKQGVNVGIALAASLDQAGKAATTEAAAKAVLDRWVELGNAGLVTGDRLAEGLQKAKTHLDEVKPGINSLAEAFTTLGLKSREALQDTEKSAREAFDYIKSNGGTLAELQAAWGKYAEAAKAANGGILPDVLRLQEEMYKVADAGRAAGQTITDSMDSASASLSRVATEAAAVRDGWARDAAGNVLTVGPDLNSLAAQHTATPEQAQMFGQLFAYYYNKARADGRYSSSLSGFNSRAAEEGAALETAAEVQRRSRSKAGSSPPPDAAPFWGSRNSYTVNLNLGGKSTPIKVTDQASADALLRVLEEAGLARP